MIKNNRGVTLIALTIVVIIILTITGMLVYSAKDSIYVKNLTNMQNDIANLRDKVSLYYSEYGKIPAQTEYTDVSNLQAAGVIGANDTGKFLIIELEILDGLTLNYGKDYERYKANDYENITDLTDIYIINENSNNIFYVQGVGVQENNTTKMYYTDYTEGDTEAVVLKEIESWHEEENEDGETIITNGIVQLKIGDYVDYDPQAGATETEYKSSKENNGYGEQIFQLASYQYGWRVLGVDEETNEILLVSEDYIGPDSGGQEENERTYYYLKGQTGYVNGENELNAISELYGQGEGATAARSIKIEDVNKITKYNPETEGYGKGEIFEYENNVTYTKNVETGNIEYKGSNGITGTSTEKSFKYYDKENKKWKNLENGESIEIDSNYYNYIGETYLSTSAIEYEMLFKNSVNSEISSNYQGSTQGCWYWLGSSFTHAQPGNVYFGLFRVYVGSVNVNNRLIDSNGSVSMNTYNGVRPVVSLKSNISIIGGEGIDGSSPDKAWKIQ